MTRSRRQRIRNLIERLPVGRGAALRLGRAAAVMMDRTAFTLDRAGPSGRGSAIPRRYTARLGARPVTTPWPEPPLIEEAASIIRRRETPGTNGPAVFDVDLFEALNAEYAAKPLVAQAIGLDEASLTERAEKRLDRVHRSIDLAGKRVLEFGCGAGFEVWLLSHHFGADAYGVDIAERSAWRDLADDRTHYALADIAEDRPFPADFFDRIVSFSVFEHVAHPHASLAELHRVLRPGGLAWISANLYRGPMASHRYREVLFPFPHLLFEDEVFREFYRRQGLPASTASWVNRLSWADYEGLFGRVGFRIRALTFSERSLDEAFYRRFESVLGRYPRWDLERDFFHVVVEKR